MPRIGTLTIALLLPLSAYGTDLTAMAHKAGFNRCDHAIAEEFKGLAQKGDGVASTGYFNNRSFSIMATWGKKKDSIWKNTTFVKFGRRCLAYSVVGSTFPSTCSVFKAENPQWKSMKQVADFTWTQNKGGVNALLKDLPNDHCSVTYRIHQAYDVNVSSATDKKSSAGKNTVNSSS
ncbi:MAG: hypothetical protein PUP46_06090 [Endozoicomonas sp. (ex Botrylloides leachii)]|nr:hypothetical protein [Endozoicomonas sp. (ex Botrylloides leachii)]